jgi:hypothetical protein
LLFTECFGWRRGAVGIACRGCAKKRDSRSLVGFLFRGISRGLFGRVYNLRLTLYDQSPPQAAQIDIGLEQASEVEKLRLTIGSVEMMDGSFCEDQTRVLEGLHHLDADRPTGGIEANALEARPSNQPEVAVDILNPQAEGSLYQPAVYLSDNNSVPWI